MPSLLSRIGNAYRELRGFAPPSASYASSWGVPAINDGIDAYKAFEDNGQLHRAVFSIATKASKTKFRLVRADKKGNLTPVASHQALETLNLPMPTKEGKSMLSAMDLKLVTYMHLLLNGESFWKLDRRMKVNNAPTKIDMLEPSLMNVTLDDDDAIIQYRYIYPKRGEILFDALDVVHFKFPDPRNWLRGSSAVGSIRYPLASYNEADELNYAKLKNSALPGGLLKTDKPVSDQDRAKYLASWNQVYGNKGRGKTAFLPQGIEFQSVQQSNADMQLVENKKLNQAEILSAFGVGLEILGQTESQTRANAESAIFVFMELGVSPFIEKFQDTLNTDYLPAFPGTEGMQFVYDDPVPENLVEKRENARLLSDNGAMTPDEMREMFGMRPLNIKGVTDVPYVNFSKMPAGDSSAFDQPEAAPPEDPPEEDPKG